MKQLDTQHQGPFELNAVIEWLKSQNYKVIRPFVPRMFYCDSPPPSNLLKAAIIDTETTGINLLTDKIIELGIVIAEYCPDAGQIYRVLETHNEFEDPDFAIPLESIKVHGITDEMVQGKKISDSVVENLMKDVSLVIAHNAAFDRKFVESRLPFFKEKAWSCSYAHIPWKKEGFASASLEFLAYRYGFHFSGHRASMDCHALLEILHSELPVSGGKVLKMLVDKLYTLDLKLWALNAPFETKDKLKERGYRWDSERKAWYTIISNEDLTLETNWLRVEIYSNRNFQLKQETIDAYNRFSARLGITEIVNY